MSLRIVRLVLVGLLFSLASGGAAPTAAAESAVRRAVGRQIPTTAPEPNLNLAGSAARIGACPAERSPTGNVQVNCLAEDTPLVRNRQLDQSEPSIAAVDNKVVVAFNDLFNISTTNGGQISYSVSRDRGQSFVDMGILPGAPKAWPYSDPSVASDDEGNIWLENLAIDTSTPPALISEIALYKMAPGSDQFELVSIPVIEGPYPDNLADKGWLTIGRDGAGKRHFYITYSDYKNLPTNPGLSTIVLLDSSDAKTWRRTELTDPSVCGAPDSVSVSDGNRLYVSISNLDAAACGSDLLVTSGRVETLTVDVRTSAVVRRTSVARVHGVGEAVELTYPNCLGDQVISTAPGVEVRLDVDQVPAQDAEGTLYMVWADRPGGLGGINSNATRIYLAYSTDRNRTWSTPQVISGPVSSQHMADRFMPWVVADRSGLHAIWYERIPDPAGGPDLVRTDKADLTLASEDRPPRLLGKGETTLSTTAFPLLPTTRSTCYMGDYIQVTADRHVHDEFASEGGRADNDPMFAVWTDLRNQVTNAQGVLQHQNDIFLQGYVPERNRAE